MAIATCAHGVSLMRFCDACEESNIRAEQHFREQRQVAADRRIVEYHQAMYGPSSEDAYLAEPEDLCRGCGTPWISHMRTDADNYCGECRNPEDR